MKSFFVFTLGGALLLGIAGVVVASVYNDVPETDLLFGGVGAFFGAKFGLIGWGVMMGARLLSAAVERIKL